MGVLLFTVVTIGSIYWLATFLRSFSNDLPSGSRRKVSALDYPRAQMPVDPVITPVDDAEVKKIPERLPQVNIDYVPPLITTPLVDRSAAVSPNFTPIATKIEESLLFRSLVIGVFIISVIAVDVAAGTH